MLKIAPLFREFTAKEVIPSNGFLFTEKETVFDVFLHIFYSVRVGPLDECVSLEDLLAFLA